MTDSMDKEYTRYERARIVGARALQILMGAPVLIKTESIDPLEIALEEMRLGFVPITVKRDRRTSR
ncbi:DNA-directed RNA polymerase subunit K [Methanotrichaceae archaeon M04Ac]|nr:MAG: DNA-directed RNA polymerase subunit K [Methanothrix harundinacea]KUK97195.1 MAG: DNA-directed RNA polymerase subunit K [Methanothrix harundinacea]MDF0593394.1 DNA-directed RNA polymerase subunit K [Candidatus Methanocrinis alkalitolerans]